MLRREEVFSVWFTLKPSLILVWWLPWVFAVPRPHPNRVNTIKFLGTIHVATSQLPNHEQRKRGRIIYENLAAWNPLTGSIIIIRACPSGLNRDYKKKGWWRIRTEKTKEKKSLSVPFKVQKMDINCGFQDMSCFSFLLVLHQSRVII